MIKLFEHNIHTNSQSFDEQLDIAENYMGSIFSSLMTMRKQTPYCQKNHTIPLISNSACGILL